MSLIINGFKIPKFIGERKSFNRYGCFLTVYKDGKAELNIGNNCYSVKEIQTPHNRLIDADRLLAVLKSIVSTNEYVPTKEVIGLIDHQPVIIEEERIK